MITHPKTEELVQAVALWIDQVRPGLDPRNAFLARVAVNVLSVVERELTKGPAAEARASEAFAEVLGHPGEFSALNAELCERIRSGDFTETTPGLLEALRTLAFDQLAIDQPKYRPEVG
ncbi:DUF6285 domain-containing protein [Phenylobacterium sp. J367]|uniref:DUF6285 domain-containing protein n=1 Tax=Phenylobacterium sp. J367 TaxID=2898435 RepID=UPI0021518447|nr:DUF6285 domain-containing protein [Phenylobacterium sp. J367]MCR5879954.1 DUF6285 domain-containing protein [Phenylobacterium sp. J367]